MKKVFALLLAVVLLIGCCACSSSDTNVRGEITPNLPDIELPSPEAPEIVATEPVIELPTEPVTESATEPATDPAFSFGEAEGSTYYNAYLGLRWTAPATWSFYTDEQIMELNNLSRDMLDEEVSQQLENATVIYDMFASSAAGDSNVNVNLEKVAPLQMIGLDLEEVFGSQLEIVKTAYENMGYTDVKVELQTVTAAGREFAGMSITANMMGVEVYAISFGFIKGNYIASVGIFSMSQDAVNEILNSFEIE